ncbi:MAG: PEP-CTERM sorting domain-containing protein [Verrucomicrobiota bacterium]
MKLHQLLLIGTALAAVPAHAATVVYLANTVTTTGGSENQLFSNANTGAGFSSGNTITSGTTTLESAQTYTALGQGSGQPGAGTNGRFNASSFGTVNYNYSTSRTLDGVLFWNYNEFFSGSTFNERGTTRADITVTHSGGTLVLDNVALTLTLDNNSSSVTAPAQTIAFGSQLTGVTQISFSDLQGTDAIRGWQEAAAFQIPEPSAALLGGLGMLALLRRRRA